MREHLYEPPSQWIADLWELTEPALRALAHSVVPTAERHPDAAVPAATLRLAKKLVADTRRIVSREPSLPGLLSMPPALTYAELHDLLGVALHALFVYRERYKPLDADSWQLR